MGITTSQANVGGTGSESLAFLEFRLDRRSGRLMRGAKSIPLRPKTWAVLIHLIDRPGVLVSRDELLDAVWPEVAVTPDTLTKSIGELREALGDDARRPRFLETVHRRGFRFIAPIAVPSSAEAARLPAAATRIVGRDEELGRLLILYGEASAGRRQFALVTGGAGVGKTALVEAFLATLTGGVSPPRIARGGCFEQYATREPYMPVLDALERLARAEGGGEVVAAMQHVAPAWLEGIPGLGDETMARRETAATRPERMLREFAALTEALSAETPMVLALEDLHWSDPSTVDLLSFLGARREPARLLVLATYRPAEVVVTGHVLGAAARSLERTGRAVSLPVHELSPRDVRDYLDQRFPGASFTASLAGLVHECSEGNPLYMIAAVQRILSRGWIVETDPGWALAASLRREDLGMPEESRELIRTQLESIPPPARAVLEVASVVGREFAVPLVATALGVEDVEVETRCETLARARWFLRPAGSGTWASAGPARRYSFTHELYRAACYADIDDGRRQRLHQRVGEALEAALGDRAGEAAAELAHHFGCSGDHVRAVRYLALAAAKARQLSASREALDYLSSALEMIARLPADHGRRVQELELRLACAPALADVHGFASDEVLDNARQAHALCAEASGEAARFQLVYGLCHLFATRADAKNVDAIVSELKDLAKRLGTKEHRLLAETALVRIDANGSRFASACRRAKRIAALRAAGVVPAEVPFGADPLVAAGGHHAMALWMTGDCATSRSVMDASLAAAEGMDQPFTLANALWWAAVLAILRRDDEEARRGSARALSLSSEHGFVQWEAAALALQGHARARLGQWHEGISDLEQALTGVRAAKALCYVGLVATGLAEASWKGGRIEAGLAAAEEGIAAGESTRDRIFLPELWRLRGELLLARAESAGGTPQRAHSRPGDLGWNEAEQCFRRAIELARAVEARAWELRAAASLVRALLVRGRAAEGHVVLRDACSAIVPDDDNRDLAEASSLVEALGGAGRRSGGRSRG